MALAHLAAKLMDKTGVRLLKAIVFSAALHLVLLILIQPARQSGTVEVVLQARLTAATTPTAARPSTTTAAEDALPIPPTTQAAATLATAPPIPTYLVPTPMPNPAQPASQPAESGAATDVPAPTEQAGQIKTGEPSAAASGQATALPEIPVMLDTRWYTAREVDRRPELLTPALPVYPDEARRRGIEGSVVIEVHIDETGRVRDIEVLEASPPGVFDAAVLDVYGKAEYSPAVLDGRPVRYIGKYRVLFELD